MKIRYLAVALIALAGLGFTQRANAILEMTYNNGSGNSSQYLVGTVLPGLQGNGGQAARDALMTNNLLAMGLGAQVCGHHRYIRVPLITLVRSRRPRPQELCWGPTSQKVQPL